MDDKYWSFDGDTYDTHATEEEAQAACEGGLDHFREDAAGGWSEDVTTIMWGRILGRCVETRRTGHHPDCRTSGGESDGCHDDCEVRTNEWDYISEYGLRREDGAEDKR